MTPPKNKPEIDYEPDEWDLTASEKRLYAVSSQCEPLLSEESQEKTTKIMDKREVEALKMIYKSDKDDYLKFDSQNFNNRETETDLCENDESREVMAIFDTAQDESKNVKLHSREKYESDMIAVEPKNTSRITKIKIKTRTFWLVFKQWLS